MIYTEYDLVETGCIGDEIPGTIEVAVEIESNDLEKVKLIKDFIDLFDHTLIYIGKKDENIEELLNLNERYVTCFTKNNKIKWYQVIAYSLAELIEEVFNIGIINSIKIKDLKERRIYNVTYKDLEDIKRVEISQELKNTLEKMGEI